MKVNKAAYNPLNCLREFRSKAGFNPEMNSKLAPMTAIEPNRYCVGDLLVDARRRCVTRNGTEIPFSNLSFDLLLALIRGAPDLVSVDELMERVWPRLVVGPETVVQRIKLVRESLNDEADQPRYIASMRGRGYRMVPPVVPLSEIGQDSPVSTLTAAPEAENQTLDERAVADGSRMNWPRRWPFAALLVIAAGIGGLLFHSEVGKKPSLALHTAIAVMPFANLTGDPAKDYLGDGMAEELINTLSKVPGLKIPARTSTFSYKGRNTDARQIAKDLGVGTLLEGSVRSVGERIRITVELIDAQDGFHLWSESYDRKFTDLFKLQDELAAAVVQALQVNLHGAELPSVAQMPPTQDVEAYGLYLQGSSLIERATPQKLSRAIEYCEQAVARDPAFARAYGCIARAHLSFSLTAALDDSHSTAAEHAAEQALALNANVPDAQLILSGINMYRGQWLEMQARDQAMLALNGNDGFTHAVTAGHLQFAGRLREGLREARQAYALAPANPFVVAVLARTLSSSALDSEALKYADLAIELGFNKNSEPLRWIYSSAALHKRQYAEAAELGIKTFDLESPDWARTAEFVKLIYAALGDSTQKDRALMARERLYPSKDRRRASMTRSAGEACITSSYAYVLLGALDVAFKLANECLDQLAAPNVVPGLNTVLALWTPEMQLFRQDARFQSFVARLGLMPYYDKYGPPDDCDLKDGKLTCR